MKWTLPEIRFDTHKYEFTHGKKPSGYGYWKFKLSDGTWFDFTGMWSEAKRAVKSSAYPLMFSVTIEVLP